MARTIALDRSSAYESPWADGCGLVVLPVHPLAVDTLESFGRLFRTALASVRCRAFPFRTPVTGLLADIPDRLIEAGNSGLEVRDRNLVLAAASVKRAALKPAPAGRGTKTTARPQDEANWEEMLIPLEKMAEGALSCPTFPAEHREMTPQVEFWDNFGFQARCSACATIWGIRTCSSCRRGYPFMRFDSEVAWSETRRGVGASDYFGMDLLAQPCPNDTSEFVCLACRRCPGAKAGRACEFCEPVQDGKYP